MATNGMLVARTACGAVLAATLASLPAQRPSSPAPAPAPAPAQAPQPGQSPFQLPVKDYLRGLRGRGNFGVKIVAKDSPFAGSHHLGEDVWLPAGTDVHAIADGVVRYSDFSPSWKDGKGAMHWNLGNVIVIEHALDPPVDGLAHVCSLYVHLGADRRVAVGDRVAKGQVVGRIGKDRSEENGLYPAHLHFGLHRGPYHQIPPSLRRELETTARTTGIVFGNGKPIRGEIELERFDETTVLVRGKSDGASLLLSLLVGSTAPKAKPADIMCWCRGYGDEATVAEWLRPSQWLREPREPKPARKGGTDGKDGKDDKG